MIKTLEKTEKYILLATLFLLPLVFLPVFSNAFTPIKLLVLLVGISLILILKCIRTVAKGSIEFSVGSLIFPVFLLTLSYILSTVLRTPNKMEALLLPGITTIVCAGFMFYLLVTQFKDTDKKELVATLFTSSVVASVVALFAGTHLLSLIPQIPANIKNPLFNTEGGALPLIMYLLAVVPFAFDLFVTASSATKKAIIVSGLVVILSAVVLSTYYILPGSSASPTFAPWDASWSVTVDNLKESPLLGAGPANFLSSFNRFLPAAYNQTKLWAVRYSSAHDFYLTVISENGLLGFTALAILVYLIVGSLKKEFREASERKLVGWQVSNYRMYSLLIVLALLAIFPASQSIIVLLFVLLALNSSVHKHAFSLSTTTESEGKQSFISTRLPSFIAIIPVVAAVVYLNFYAARIAYGEFKFKNALDSITANNGIKTYALLTEAISANPYVDRYHSINSEVNIALANSLAQKKDLTDADKQTIRQLIQQSINEAKATIYLNPQRSGGWELLARIYRTVMPFTTGADQFALQSYAQAVVLDPQNPNLRLAFGGVYYSLKDYDNAIEVFKLATYTKPDFANLHYNLAIAYRDKGDFDRAVAEMTAVLSLVKKDTPDYKTAKDELDSLEKKKPATTNAEVNTQKARPAGGTTLTTPAPVGESPIKPPLELPSDATPPASPASQSPGGPATPVTPAP